jgi:ABC-2 type transport system ATP-binding protein
LLLTVDIKEAGYANDSPVIKEIGFTVQPGELVGLIGPNGAGKSTTIKSILGIMNYLKGNIELKEYAYIPERPIFYDRLTLWEHIDFLQTTLTEGQCNNNMPTAGQPNNNMPTAGQPNTKVTAETQFTTKANELLELFGLTNQIHNYPENFSKGMQQKVMLILAFLKQPDLYIIDEPFMGLDPKAIKKLLQLIEKEKARGAGILMSTHALDTAEKICDRFALISDGKLIIEGTLDDIRKQSGRTTGSLFDCFDVLTERD